MEKIFGLTEEELKKQLGASEHQVDPEYKMKPINPGETLEPAIRGSKKILEDPELRERMRRIYRGISE